MPRYVILHHETPAGSERPAHWDLLLETGDVLRAWALEEPPREDAAIAAMALADHRRRYLDYEGEISGGRGTVARWDAGEYDILAEDSERLIIRIAGERLRGNIELAKLQAPNWTCRYWVE